MNITIKEIADIANVSTATVSLVLNNKPGVGQDTRQRILKITQMLKEERYKQQALTQIAKGSIRFLKIVKHGQVLNRDHDTFVSRYIDGMEQEARQNAYKLEINTFTTSDIHEIIPYIKDSDVDGIIILGTELNRQDFKAFQEIDIPLGFIDTRFEDKRFDFVDMDNIQGAFQVVNHFVEHNHHKIGFINSPVELRNFEFRHLGFQAALSRSNIPYNRQYVFSVNATFDGAYHDMLHILRKGTELPTALFSANDLIAYACIKAFKEVGVKIPEDVSIIGFDDLPMSSMMDPPLTTMKVSQRQMGQMAIQLLIGRINRTLKAPTIKVNIGGQLICRNSVKTL